MFNAFERKVAARYLRARRGERFVSVIAIFSLVGIALGVATLIIVMSVMNGFRQELLSQILGLNGDIGVYGAGAPLDELRRHRQPRSEPSPVSRRLSRSSRARCCSPARKAAQSAASRAASRRRAWPHCPPSPTTSSPAASATSRATTPSPSAAASPASSASRSAQNITLDPAAGQGHHHRHHPQRPDLQGRRDLPDRHAAIRFELRLPAARRRADLVPATQRRDADPGLRHRSGQ